MGASVRLKGDAASAKGVSSGWLAVSVDAGWVDTTCESLPDEARNPLKIRSMDRILKPGLTAFCLVALVACGPICGIGAKFALSNAHVDSSYTCPYPSDHVPYDVHASVLAENSLSNTVTIKSMTYTWTNIAVHGNWSGTKGDHGTDNVTDYSPKSVGGGGKATIKFTLGFECTNSGAGADTYGDFSFKFTFKTSSGTYTTSPNTHRLQFAAP